MSVKRESEVLHDVSGWANKRKTVCCNPELFLRMFPNGLLESGAVRCGAASRRLPLQGFRRTATKWHDRFISASPRVTSLSGKGIEALKFLFLKLNEWMTSRSEAQSITVHQAGEACKMCSTYLTCEQRSAPRRHTKVHSEEVLRGSEPRPLQSGARASFSASTRHSACIHKTFYSVLIFVPLSDVDVKSLLMMCAPTPTPTTLHLGSCEAALNDEFIIMTNFCFCGESSHDKSL